MMFLRSTFLTLLMLHALASVQGHANTLNSGGNSDIEEVADDYVSERYRSLQRKRPGRRKLSSKKSSTRAPTRAPSTSPSNEPTMSMEPSASPTSTPSVQPTLSQQPSASPSSSPSAVPSASPSATPTSSPSASPSDKPSASPSAAPSATPTLSQIPSYSPSASPSRTPSNSPSVSPSSSPTLMPSSGPTLSIAPTRNDLAFSVSENGYSVTECKLNPIPAEASNSVVDQLIAWSFRMCTTRSGIDNILTGVGVELEEFLRDAFLTCDYQEEVEVAALSFPQNGFIEKTSEEEVENCYVFEHSFEMTIFVLPDENRLRKLEVEPVFSDSSFRDRMGQNLMNKINSLSALFIGVNFQWEGFTNTAASVQDPEDDTNDFNGNALQANDAITPPQKSSSPSTAIAVSAVLIASALIAIVVIVAVRRRRRNQRDTENLVRVPLYDDEDSQYGKSMNDHSLYTSGHILRDLEAHDITANDSGDSEDHSSAGYTKAYVVAEREEESLAMMADDDVEVEFRGNASDEPVFIHVENSHRTPIKTRGYYHSDTVDL